MTKCGNKTNNIACKHKDYFTVGTVHKPSGSNEKNSNFAFESGLSKSDPVGIRSFM